VRRPAVAVTSSAFIFTPVTGGATYMYVLAAMPSLALCLRKEDLKPYFAGFLAVAALYAGGLVLQMWLDVRTTAYHYEGRYAWPLLDPNNAAMVVNMALIPCLHMALNEGRRWHGPVALFCAAGAAAFVLCSARYGRGFVPAALAALALAAASALHFRPGLIAVMAHSFADRFPIWEASLPLLWIRPLLGLGLGSFGHYYEQVRTEQYTVGWHSHNDLLNFAVEMGVPAALVFCALCAAVALTTRRANLPAACVLLAVLLQSMVEFQFYIAPVSLMAGLALGWHISNAPKRKALA
jgi:hypothetical protein